MRSLVVLFALVAVGMAAPNLNHYTYAVPSAVSHQSRVDVHQSPAVVTSYGTPAVVEARSVYSPVAAVYSAPSAVSHQSRVDYQSSPAVVTQQVVSPAVYGARSVYAPSVYTPSVYNPSVYGPAVYAPSVYAPYW